MLFLYSRHVEICRKRIERAPGLNKQKRFMSFNIFNTWSVNIVKCFWNSGVKANEAAIRGWRWHGVVFSIYCNIIIKSITYVKENSMFYQSIINFNVINSRITYEIKLLSIMTVFGVVFITYNFREYKWDYIIVSRIFTQAAPSTLLELQRNVFRSINSQHIMTHILE